MRVQIKTMAKSQIKGNIGTLFLITLVIGALTAVANLIPGVGQLASSVVLIPAFTLATTKIYLNLTKGEKPEVTHLFNSFDKFLTAFVVQLLVGVFTFLWSLLFVVPGIIKAISYSQAMYILAENPDISALEAIRRSKVMMSGHKMEYFVLGLSFIGWSILGVLTFGILFIWLTPYMSATYANFYNSIKPETEAEPAVETTAEPAAE